MHVACWDVFSLCICVFHWSASAKGRKCHVSLSSAAKQQELGGAMTAGPVGSAAPQFYTRSRWNVLESNDGSCSFSHELETDTEASKQTQKLTHVCVGRWEAHTMMELKGMRTEMFFLVKPQDLPFQVL